HADPKDPPRRRANTGQGHGTWDSDRPPLLGAVGRRSKRLRLRLAKRMWGASLVGFVTAATRPGATVDTDEWGGDGGLARAGRGRGGGRGGAGAGHRGRGGGGAGDGDGDGVREAHCNTMEGIWTGVRIFLAGFRGVSKWYQAQYAAVFEWAHDTKRVAGEFVR